MHVFKTPDIAATCDGKLNVNTVDKVRWLSNPDLSESYFEIQDMKTSCEIAILRDDTRFCDGKFLSRCHFLTAPLKDKYVKVIFSYYCPLIVAVAV